MPPRRRPGRERVPNPPDPLAVRDVAREKPAAVIFVGVAFQPGFHLLVGFVVTIPPSAAAGAG